MNLIVEIKGYHLEDAKDKKATGTYWIPSLNHLKTFGRWVFAGLTKVYQIEMDFKAKVEAESIKMKDTCQLNSV